MRMITTKHEVLGDRVDLKEFFEASIGALQGDVQGSKQTIRRNAGIGPSYKEPGLIVLQYSEP